MNVRLSVNFIGSGGRFWKAGEELPSEIVPERVRRYSVGPTGSSADSDDVPTAVPADADNISIRPRERPRAAKEKTKNSLPAASFEG
jgi:hypothetical protein